LREIINESRGGAGLTILIASSVVRGSQQGESHGGVYLVDTQRNTFEQVIDWNTPDIDWQGRGWDRGLRGIAFDGAQVFMAASNELFVYSPDFRLLAAYRNPFLMHAHEIAVHERRLYLTSTGFDSVLGFDLDRREFCFGLHVKRVGGAFQARLFDPSGNRGPAASNDLHINSVFCNADGMYISGLKTASLLRYQGGKLKRWASLPRRQWSPHSTRSNSARFFWLRTKARSSIAASGRRCSVKKIGSRAIAIGACAASVSNHTSI
jgi:hypothetical protein